MKAPQSPGSRIYLTQLALVVVGLVLVGAGPWRIGIGVIGGAFLAGAAARITVPTPDTGMLRVRGKAFDIVWMSILGVALVTLAIVVPPQPA